MQLSGGGALCLEGRLSYLPALVSQHSKVIFSTSIPEFNMYCYRQAAIVVCGSGCNYMQTIGSMSIAHPEARGPTVFYSMLVFYPRDAVLARVLAMALCLSVCHKSVFSQKG